MSVWYSVKTISASAAHYEVGHSISQGRRTLTEEQFYSTSDDKSYADCIRAGYNRSTNVNAFDDSRTPAYANQTPGTLFVMHETYFQLS